jgi:hypothetical protein
MCLQRWCVPVGAGDVLDPADGDAAAPDDCVDPDDDDADDGFDDVAVVEVTADVGPLVDARATPATPAPRPAARTAVITKRRARPPVLDAMFPPSPVSAHLSVRTCHAHLLMRSRPSVRPAMAPGCAADPVATRSAALRIV